MKHSLLVIGISHHGSPIEFRERFWMGETRRLAALRELPVSQGIEEAALLATCNRLEFILWSSDSAAAGESVRVLLRREFSMAPEEWSAFYRHEGDAALQHVFRVAASLDSMVVGEPEITGQVKTAWAQAQQAGATGRFLDAVFQKALTVSKRVRNETAIGATAVSVPYAAVELARQIFGSLEKRNVMVLGAGKMSERSARYLLKHGAGAIWVANRTHAHAETLARELGGTAVRFEDRWQFLAQADIVISSTGCPHVILAEEDARRIHQERQGRPVFLIDIAVPRDIDPAVRRVPGVFLYDIDDLEQVVQRNRNGRQAAAVEAEQIVACEVQGFSRKLAAQRVAPTIVALRERLEEIRRRELENYRSEFGPLTPGQEQALEKLTSQIIQRIASQLAREIKDIPERPEQERLTAALRRLFGLRGEGTAAECERHAAPRPALAGNT